VTTLYTVGHGTLPAGAFGSLLDGVPIRRLVDVRSFPGSRHNPQFRRESMEAWVPAAGVEYVWIRELGGRRKPVAGSRHVALRNDAFRAYADHMTTSGFHSGVEQLLDLAESDPTTVMCSESVWWRCHRRLLADHLVLVRGVDVVHLMHDGRLTPHVPTDGVRVVDGELVYDVGVTLTT
jgi:uncharacterized protein (DUF488 family)